MIHSGLVMNIKTHECTLNEKPLSLTPQNFQFTYFMPEKGNVVSAEELFHQIWEMNISVRVTIPLRFISVTYVKNGRFEDPKYIKTIWGADIKLKIIVNQLK